MKDHQGEVIAFTSQSKWDSVLVSPTHKCTLEVIYEPVSLKLVIEQVSGFFHEQLCFIFLKICLAQANYFLHKLEQRSGQQ